MFLKLFYGLREAGVPTSIQEWQMLMTALEKGVHGSNLLSFYHLSRATLVKSEAYFDAFDRVFARIFQGVEGQLSVTDEITQWLSDPKRLWRVEKGVRSGWMSGSHPTRLSEDGR